MLYVITLLLIYYYVHHRRSLIKQPSRTGNKKVIKTLKFRRGSSLCQILLLCAYNLSILLCWWFLWMEPPFKVTIGRIYYVELVGKRIPNRCCLWLRRVGHISRADAYYRYRVSGFTDSGRPYWLRNTIFFSDISVLTFTYLLYENWECVRDERIQNIYVYLRI